MNPNISFKTEFIGIDTDLRENKADELTDYHIGIKIEQEDPLDEHFGNGEVFDHHKINIVQVGPIGEDVGHAQPLDDHNENKIKQERPIEEDIDDSVDEILNGLEIKIEDTQLIDTTVRSKTYECHVCKYSAGNIADLQMHIKKHPKCKECKPLQCPECSKRFVFLGDMRRHMFTHSEDRTVSCSLCPKKFKTNACLRQHMRKHDDVKPFSCDECGKKLKTRNGFRIHLRIHSGEKPFKCKLCSCRCTTSGELLNHMRVRHTGEKKFVCEVCSKRFSASVGLLLHRRVHTGK